jgi:hypothetical protein
VEGETPIEIRWRLLGRAASYGWLVLLAAVLLWPITRAGYLLGHDMVFTPEQPLGLPAVGVSSAPPRAVPLDALVALAERIADGAVVGRLALVLPVLAAGLGAMAILRTLPLPARLAAATVAVWNPFVAERLALGQWALLWCYAALPWLVLAITRGRGRAGWLARGAALAAASITPTGGLIAAAVAITVAAGTRRPRRDLLATTALALALQLPWLVPALVSTATTTSDSRGVAAFAARAEHPGGVLLSLLGGGGVWDRAVVPDSRGGVLPWIWLAVLAAAAVYGTPTLVARLGARLVATLAALSLAGLTLAVLPSSPAGAALVRALVDHVPGAGLLRDAQKWLLPLVLLEALMVGAAVGRLAERTTAVAWRPLLLVAAVTVPLIVLPDAAATVRPSLEPVHYPTDWSTVSRLVERNRVDGGDVAVLPTGSYRTFAWAPGRSVLDPAPRLLPVAAVVDDRLAVSGELLAGEDRRAAAVRRAMRLGPGLAAGLAAQGIAWVVVEHGTPGWEPGLAELHPVYRGRDVSLYRVPGEIDSANVPIVRTSLVLAADLGAVLTLIGLAWWVVRERFPPRRARRRIRPEDDPALL